MDPKRFTRRLIALGAAMFLCALVFVITLFDAQIVNGDDYLSRFRYRYFQGNRTGTDRCRKL